MEFEQFLRECAGGRIDEQLTDCLRALAAQVVSVDKAGKLTLTITLKPNTTNAVIAEAKVDMKLPEAPPEASIFFVDGDYNLSRRDPRQMVLSGLRDVEEERTR